MAVTISLILYGLPILAVVVAVLKILALLRQRWHYQTILSSFPGPPAHWWYGNTKLISGDFQGMLRTVGYSNQFGGIFPVWTGSFEATLLAVHPSTAKNILAGMDPKDEFSYSLLEPWLGDGLLLQSGAKWERNRRLLTPAFHVDMLKSHVDVFTQTVSELVDKWKALDGQIEMFHHASLLTMDSMLRCLFSHVSNCQQEKTRHQYIQAVYDVSDLIMKRLSYPLLMVDAIYRYTENGRKFRDVCETIHSYSQNLIRERRRTLGVEGRKGRNLDFLDVLLTAQDSDGQGLNDQEIQAEVDTFMFAGHDSTASSLSWCLYNLAAHPHWQDACRREAFTVLGGRDRYTWDDLKQMEVIWASIQESMRLYPAVPNLSRCTGREIPLSDGRVIPKGVRVGVSVFALHRNPELWNDPEAYDPQRFLDGNKDTLSTYFMPFSVGPRNCIGRIFAQTQLKTAVATILCNFKLHVVPDKLPIPESSLILRSRDGVYLTVESLR